MKVIGTVGRNGSGKDSLLNYLHEKYHVPIFASGDVARDIAAREGVPRTRDRLHEISMEFMEKHGRDFFVRELVPRIEENVRGRQKAAGISGIRTPEDAAFLRRFFGDEFALVYVEAEDPRLRFERIQERAAQRDRLTYDEFLEKDKREAELFNLDETAAQADVTIPNTGSVEEFHRAIEDKLVEPLLPFAAARRKSAGARG